MTDELEDGFAWETWVYQGKRFGSDDKMRHVWAELNDGEVGEDHHYGYTRGERYVVGGIYEIPVNPERTVKLKMAKFKEKLDDPIIHTWAAEDSAAQVAKGQKAALDAAMKESKDDISSMSLREARRFIHSGKAHSNARLAVVLKELGIAY